MEGHLISHSKEERKKENIQLNFINGLIYNWVQFIES